MRESLDTPRDDLPYEGYYKMGRAVWVVRVGGLVVGKRVWVKATIASCLLFMS